MISEGPAIAAGRQAAEELECPACRTGQEALSALIQRLLQSETGGVDWLSVCTTHAWQLIQWPRLAGLLAAAQLRSALNRLDQASAPSSTGRLARRREAVPLRGEGECPFCATMRSAAHDVLAPVAATGDENVALCLPHVCEALALAKGRDQVRTVARAAGASYAALERDLAELIRMSDYRFRGEPRGPEATSWMRAARLLAGAPGVRWTWRRDPRIES